MAVFLKIAAPVDPYIGDRRTRGPLSCYNIPLAWKIIKLLSFFLSENKKELYLNFP
jgi:hypothetical protein